VGALPRAARQLLVCLVVRSGRLSGRVELGQFTVDVDGDGAEVLMLLLWAGGRGSGRRPVRAGRSRALRDSQVV
jgi:hypothetical protein